MGMIHNETQQKADEDAVAAGRCPECGQDLTKVDPRNHLETEFPRWQEPGVQGSDYARRASLIDAYATHVEEKSSKAAGH